MNFPKVTVIPGVDKHNVYLELNAKNINYSIASFKIILNGISRISVDKFNIRSQDFYLNELKNGMDLELFSNVSNMSFNFLEGWNPQPLKIDPNDLILNSDINTFNKIEKKLIINILYYAISHEQELLNIYQQHLSIIFLNPDVANMLKKFTICVKGYLEMWNIIRKNLNISQFPEFKICNHCNGIPKIAMVVEILTKTIAMQENIYTCIQECLESFSKQGKLIGFVRLVKYRDEESNRIGKIILKLLNELEIQYPFIKIMSSTKITQARKLINFKEDALFDNFNTKFKQIKY